MRFKTKYQHGVSIVSLLLFLMICGALGVIGMKVVPTVTEYLAVKRAIMIAKTTGTSVREIEMAFDQQAGISYIEAISGKDLEITKNGDAFDISFMYQKKIPLVGPASLIMDYSGSTEEKPDR